MLGALDDPGDTVRGQRLLTQDRVDNRHDEPDQRPGRLSLRLGFAQLLPEPATPKIKHSIVQELTIWIVAATKRRDHPAISFDVKLS